LYGKPSSVHDTHTKKNLFGSEQRGLRDFRSFVYRNVKRASLKKKKKERKKEKKKERKKERKAEKGVKSNQRREIMRYKERKKNNKGRAQAEI
jgi:hypothetical protein